VGLSVEASEMPSVGLVPGDQVEVIAQDASGSGTVAADNAQVVAVEELDAAAGESNRWWITLRSTEDEARGLALVTVGDVPIQIVLVGR
jgi:hypothetical protein